MAKEKGVMVSFMATPEQTGYLKKIASEQKMTVSQVLRELININIPAVSQEKKEVTQ